MLSPSCSSCRAWRLPSPSTASWRLSQSHQLAHYNILSYYTCGKSQSLTSTSCIRLKQAGHHTDLPQHIHASLSFPALSFVRLDTLSLRRPVVYPPPSISASSSPNAQLHLDLLHQHPHILLVDASLPCIPCIDSGIPRNLHQIAPELLFCCKVFCVFVFCGGKRCGGEVGLWGGAGRGAGGSAAMRRS